MAGTVTIACKWGPGIFINAYRMDEREVPALGGGTRKEFFSTPVGPNIRINGPHVPHGERPAFIIKGGYALTPGVPEEVAREWFRVNATSELVRNNVVFIQDKAQNAAAQATEMAEIRSGIERFDTSTKVVDGGKTVHKDPRWPIPARQLRDNLSSDTHVDGEAA